METGSRFLKLTVKNHRSAPLISPTSSVDFSLVLIAVPILGLDSLQKFYRISQRTS